MFKHFFCHSFTIGVGFEKNGIVTGWLRDGFTATTPFVFDFGGIFLSDGKLPEFSFYINWPFAFDDCDLTTAFAGRIHKSPGCEVLKLEWLLSSRIKGQIDPIGITDSCLLVGTMDSIKFSLDPEYGTPFEMARRKKDGTLKNYSVYNP